MSQTDTPAAGSQRKMPVLKIRNKPGTEGMLTTGANVEITLDGQRVPLVTFLKLELKPKNVAKVTIELFAEVDAEINVDNLTQVSKKYDPGKCVHVLQNLEPVGFKK